MAGSQLWNWEEIVVLYRWQILAFVMLIAAVLEI